MKYARGDIAQLVEHFNGIEGVSGSNPLISINFSSDILFAQVGIQQVEKKLKGIDLIRVLFHACFYLSDRFSSLKHRSPRCCLGFLDRGVQEVVATACAVAFIVLWSGFWNSSYCLIRCTTMGAISRFTSATLLIKGKASGHLQMEKCQPGRGLSRLNRIFSYSREVM